MDFVLDLPVDFTEGVLEHPEFWTVKGYKTTLYIVSKCLGSFEFNLQVKWLHQYPKMSERTMPVKRKVFRTRRLADEISTNPLPICGIFEAFADEVFGGEF